MSSKEKEILNIIKTFVEENKYSPSIRELCKFSKLKSTASVHSYLKRLKEKGYIDYMSNKNRTLRVIK